MECDYLLIRQIQRSIKNNTTEVKAGMNNCIHRNSMLLKEVSDI